MKTETALLTSRYDDKGNFIRASEIPMSRDEVIVALNRAQAQCVELGGTFERDGLCLTVTYPHNGYRTVYIITAIACS